MKVDLEVVKRILRHSNLENGVVSELLDEIQSAAEDKSNEKGAAKQKPIKKQFVVIGSSSDDDMAAKACWVFQIPADETPQSIQNKLMESLKSFRLSKNGRRYAVNNLSEACNRIPAKVFKEQRLWCKSKEPTWFIQMDPELD